MNTFMSGSVSKLILRLSFVGVLLAGCLFSATTTSAQSIVLNPPIPVMDDLEVGDTYNEPGGRLYDSEGNELPWSLVAISSNVDMSKRGSYQVVYSYLSARETRFVSVADATAVAPNGPPTILVSDVLQEPFGRVVDTLGRAKCIDDDPGDTVAMVATPATIPATAPAGTDVLVTFTCRDSYGNLANKTATFEIIGAVSECGYRGGRCVAGSTCGDGEMSTADACTDFSEICCVPVTNDDNDDSNGTGGGVSPDSSGGAANGAPVTSRVAPGNLVPCEGAGCSACDLVKLGNNVLVWLIGILFIVFAIIAVSAGFGLVTSGGNPEAKSAAKKKMTNAVIGFIVVLAAWLLVDTIMRMLLSGSTGEIRGYGPWSEVECGRQTAAQPAPVKLSGSEPPLGIGSGMSESYVAGTFADEDVGVVATGECTDPSKKTCTGLAGMQLSTVDSILDINDACPECNIVVTAGTEIGHSNPCHRNGTCADIDCRPADNSNKCSLDHIVSINAAATDAGRRAVYETKDCAERDAAREVGVEAYCSSDAGYSHITGGHFSIYEGN